MDEEGIFPVNRAQAELVHGDTYCDFKFHAAAIMVGYNTIRYTGGSSNITGSCTQVMYALGHRQAS